MASGGLGCTCAELRRIVNAVLRMLVGDMAALPNTNTWHAVVLEDGQVALLSDKDKDIGFATLTLNEAVR